MRPARPSSLIPRPWSHRYTFTAKLLKRWQLHASGLARARSAGILFDAGMDFAHEIRRDSHAFSPHYWNVRRGVGGTVIWLLLVPKVALLQPPSLR
jgi:hypothetical protein